ncbi:hypothetical protein, partial [Actinacidiphila rubida]|uniref:hypothetical protein n=1 Tax=Actinacidiphila rubida TaxID=310780 RepID=UPI00159F02E8
QLAGADEEPGQPVEPAVDGAVLGLGHQVGTGQLKAAPAPATYYDGAAFVRAAQAGTKAAAR